MANTERRVSVGVTSSGRKYLAETRGITAGGDTAGAGGGGGAGGVTDDFLNQSGGPVLRDVQLQPVFWGTSWKKGTEPFAVADMVGQLRTLHLG